MMGDDWHDICACEELNDEEILQFWVDDTAIAVVNMNGDYFAIADQCTHQSGSLAEGAVVDELIECPLHQGRYYIASGAAHSGPACEDLPVYPVAIHNGRLYVQYAEER